MAETKQVREENEELFSKPEHNRQAEYLHGQAIKAGNERQDRRSSQPNKGAAKKAGHGGKFTLDGPYAVEDYVDAPPAALDEHDPNYTDAAEEAADKEAGLGGGVEVAKVANDRAHAM